MYLNQSVVFIWNVLQALHDVGLFLSFPSPTPSDHHILLHLILGDYERFNQITDKGYSDKYIHFCLNLHNFQDQLTSPHKKTTRRFVVLSRIIKLFLFVWHKYIIMIFLILLLSLFSERSHKRIKYPKKVKLSKKCGTGFRKKLNEQPFQQIYGTSKF